MRGEHAVSRVTMQSDWGSSPHARGAHAMPPSQVDGGGIIPACAGSTKTSFASVSSGWDHPRMRGEHLPFLSFRQSSQGSSPHARGAPDGRGVLHPPVGIIPACAGSTARGSARLGTA